MNGEIFFDMTETSHPISGSSKFLLKRWTKHTIYAKNKNYIRANYMNAITGEYTNYPVHGTYYRQSNPLNLNLYSTSSIYLYDYVVVTDTFFKNIVYSNDTVDTTPIQDVSNPGYTWNHLANTFKNSPNAITNNYTYTYNIVDSNALHAIGKSQDVYGLPVIYRDDGTFFEIVKGYPRNHYTHKRSLFSLDRTLTFGKMNNNIISSSYYRNRQTTTTTIGQNGLEDGSDPIQTIQVGNVNLIQANNTINQ